MSADPGWFYSFSIDEADQAAFQRLSGDSNPLHYDSAFARRSGFEGPVVFGAMIVAKISGFLGSIFPGSGCIWSKLAIDFRAPLYVGQEAVLEVVRSYANDDLCVWDLSIRVVIDRKVIAIGSVRVSRRME